MAIPIQKANGARIISNGGEKPAIFSQETLFKLRAQKLMLPTERLLLPKEYERAGKNGLGIKKGAYATNRYAVFRKDLESSNPGEIGRSVVWAQFAPSEDGHFRIFTRGFVVPDVAHPSEKGKGLRESVGVLIFNFDKIKYDASIGHVMVTQAFDPKKDVEVLSPQAFWQINATMRPLANFERIATGWHGNVLWFPKHGEGFNYGEWWHLDKNAAITPVFSKVRE